MATEAAWLNGKKREELMERAKHSWVQSQRDAGEVAGLAYPLSFAALIFAQFRIQDCIIVNRSREPCRARILGGRKAD